MIGNIFLIVLLVITIIILVVQLTIVHSTIKLGIPPIPSGDKRIRSMLDLANIKPGMQVCDLGCGDGRILKALKPFKDIELIGIEGNKPVALWAQFKNQHAKVIYGDFFSFNMDEVDVIFCYLYPSIMDRVREEIWPQLKPGCQLISHSFPLGIKAKKTVEVSHNIKVYKYVKA